MSSSTVPIEARDVSLEGADNQRLANFAGPMEQNLRHVEERLGVEVHTDSVVTRIDEAGVAFGNESIAAQTVLWAAGVAAFGRASSL